jgi:hypothetical protein
VLSHPRKRPLAVFEKRMLRGIFRPKREEVTGEWRRFHNVEHYTFYSSPDIRVVIGRKII